MVVISTGTNLLLPPCCYKVSSHQWTHVDSNTHTLPASSAIPKMTWMCIDSKTWSISWHRRRGRTHTHTPCTSAGVIGKEAERTSTRVFGLLLFFFFFFVWSKSKSNDVLFSSQRTRYHFPTFLRLSEDLTYGPTLHPMCVCVCVYTTHVYLYMFILRLSGVPL